MRKGIDVAMFRKVKVDNYTGRVVEDVLVYARPAHGKKVLRKRHAAAKVSKAARKRNR